MAYICDICGKGKQFGHNVSFSQRKTQKIWKPNLQKRKLTIGNTTVSVKVCAQCLRTLQKYQREGSINMEIKTQDTPVTPKSKATAKA